MCVIWPPYEGGLSWRVLVLVCCVLKGLTAKQWCVLGWGHVAEWRIKLAAVVYRLSPLSICSARPRRHLCSQAQLQPPTPPPKSPSPCLSHTQFWIPFLIIHHQPSHDRIYSVQPLLPRVLWLSAMQISHVLIAIIYFCGRGKEARGGASFRNWSDDWAEKETALCLNHRPGWYLRMCDYMPFSFS